ncbi:MAG: S9 family peptidase [Bacteroidales bacterium]|jgi:dipeptidyl aminopeptidase/acylaminoacyl peptidase|nr:S9 family peptidase [Bacteroidales bacterium]
MKRYLVPIILAFLILSVSCKQKAPDNGQPTQQFSTQLTEEEKAGGLMTPEIMWKFGRLGNIALSPDGSTVLYTVTERDLMTEASRTNIFSLAISGGEAVRLTDTGGSSPQWLDDGKSIAFVDDDGNLVLMDTKGSVKHLVEGLTNFEAYSISPSGNKIYFTRRVKLDQTANEKYNLPNAKVRIIDDLMYRHWNYWSDYSYSHIFVADFNGKNVTGEKDIMEGQKFESPLSPYFDESEISWSPDGRFIAFTTKRLRGAEDARSTNSDIFLYEISSGKEVNVTEPNRGYDRYPIFSPDGSKIAFQSMERDGYEADLDRLFVYDIKTGTRTWITKGWEFDVESVKWADEQNIFFICAYMGTSQVFKTNIKGKGVDQVTEGKHELGSLELESGKIVASIMSFSMAAEVAAVDISTGEVKQLSEINKSIYESIKMGKSEEKYIKTKDGKDLQMWIVFPPDFDPAKKYPTLLFCNGGPQSTLGPFWSYRWNLQMMAAKGYIVFAPNRRGNAGFGQIWKEQISGDYGGKNIQDYLDATDAMAKEPYVDAERLGAVGASYGGYSVFYLAGIHGGRFKTFISHCGVFNFISEYGSTEELWFNDFDYGGPYWDMPKSYQYSPHLIVDNWDTPILIITGANDFRIPYTQSMEAFTAAQLHSIPSRLLFFEDESHWVLKPQNSVIWQMEFFDWLDTYLK